MKAEEFDQAFDRGEDVSSALDLAAAQRPGLEQRRVNVDFPVWMIESLDREARRLGVTRQSVIKVWIAEHLERRDSAAALHGHPHPDRRQRSEACAVKRARCADAATRRGTRSAPQPPRRRPPAAPRRAGSAGVWAASSHRSCSALSSFGMTKMKHQRPRPSRIDERNPVQVHDQRPAVICQLIQALPQLGHGRNVDLPGDRAITTPCSSRTAMSRAPPMTSLPSHANVPRPTDRAAAITRKRDQVRLLLLPASTPVMPARGERLGGSRGARPFGTHGGVELQRRADVNRLRSAPPGASTTVTAWKTPSASRVIHTSVIRDPAAASRFAASW